MKIAIVTGASSGLGEEYIRSISAGTYDVDEIWAVARRKERLIELSEKYGKNKKIVPISLDLTKYESYTKLKCKLEEEKTEIKLVVNNAGYGTLGDFDSKELLTQTGMVDLNARALVAVSSLVLPYMHRGSFIINVCSIAAFAPNPRMAVYCSTKAFVYSFSKALRYELKNKGINILAVCPGPMDTEFLSVAGIEKGSSHTFDTLPRCNPRKVAEISLKKASEGKGKYTPKVFYKFYRCMAKLLPHSLVMKLSKT